MHGGPEDEARLDDERLLRHFLTTVFTRALLRLGGADAPSGLPAELVAECRTGLAAALGARRPV